MLDVDARKRIMVDELKQHNIVHMNVCKYLQNHHYNIVCNTHLPEYVLKYILCGWIYKTRVCIWIYTPSLNPFHGSTSTVL